MYYTRFHFTLLYCSILNYLERNTITRLYYSLLNFTAPYLAILNYMLYLALLYFNFTIRYHAGPSLLKSQNFWVNMKTTTITSKPTTNKPTTKNQQPTTNNNNKNNNNNNNNSNNNSNNNNNNNNNLSQPRWKALTYPLFTVAPDCDTLVGELMVMVVENKGVEAGLTVDFFATWSCCLVNSVTKSMIPPRCLFQWPKFVNREATFCATFVSPIHLYVLSIAWTHRLGRWRSGRIQCGSVAVQIEFLPGSGGEGCLEQAWNQWCSRCSRISKNVMETCIIPASIKSKSIK